MEERKARQNTRGEKASIKKGIPRILLGGLKNHAENSSSRLSNVHAEKAGKIQQEITSLKGSLSRTDKLKTDFNAPALHTGKILVTARDINFHYPDSDANLWPAPLSFQLRSGSRLCIKGNNGSGTDYRRTGTDRRSDRACRLYLCLSGSGILPYPKWIYRFGTSGNLQSAASAGT